MTDPSPTGATPDPAVAGLYEYIERLKAAEKLLSDLLSAGPAGTDTARTAATPNTENSTTPGPPAERGFAARILGAPAAPLARWRRRTN